VHKFIRVERIKRVGVGGLLGGELVVDWLIVERDGRRMRSGHVNNADLLLAEVRMHALGSLLAGNQA
jgi:hypothetical protein